MLRARCHRHVLTLRFSSPLDLLSVLWCVDGMAAILYARVEGEEPIGEEKLQEGDSVQSVVERAVEKERIESIRWKDVAGWKLLVSREEDAKEVKSGTSSERLSKLPPFPDESVLILTRGPVPPITTSSALGEIQSRQSRQSYSNHQHCILMTCEHLGVCVSLSVVPSLSLSVYFSPSSVCVCVYLSFSLSQVVGCETSHARVWRRIRVQCTALTRSASAKCRTTF